MNAERLIEMANDIGNYFKAEPDHDEAVHSVYDHLRKYWESRMQRKIVEYINQHGDEELQPLAREAVQRLKQDVEQAA